MSLIARQSINDAASVVTNTGGAGLNGQYQVHSILCSTRKEKKKKLSCFLCTQNLTAETPLGGAIGVNLPSLINENLTLIKSNRCATSC
jgi:hypothetical protein